MLMQRNLVDLRKILLTDDLDLDTSKQIHDGD